MGICCSSPSIVLKSHELRQCRLRASILATRVLLEAGTLVSTDDNARSRFVLNLEDHLQAIRFYDLSPEAREKTLEFAQIGRFWGFPGLGAFGVTIEYDELHDTHTATVDLHLRDAIPEPESLEDAADTPAALVSEHGSHWIGQPELPLKGEDYLRLPQERRLAREHRLHSFSITVPAWELAIYDCTFDLHNFMRTDPEPVHEYSLVDATEPREVPFQSIGAAVTDAVNRFMEDNGEDGSEEALKRLRKDMTTRAWQVARMQVNLSVSMLDLVREAEDHARAVAQEAIVLAQGRSESAGGFPYFQDDEEDGEEYVRLLFKETAVKDGHVPLFWAWFQPKFSRRIPTAEAAMFLAEEGDNVSLHVVAKPTTVAPAGSHALATRDDLPPRHLHDIEEAPEETSSGVESQVPTTEAAAEAAAPAAAAASPAAPASRRAAAAASASAAAAPAPLKVVREKETVSHSAVKVAVEKKPVDFYKDVPAHLKEQVREEVERRCDAYKAKRGRDPTLEKKRSIKDAAVRHFKQHATSHSGNRKPRRKPNGRFGRSVSTARASSRV
jgi:hypothetical protein